MHILIVKLSAIGDVLHTLPALNAIRKQFPDAHITWLVEEAADRLVAINPMTKWPTKPWDNLKFAQLADRLIRDHGARVVFTGSPEDREAVKEIMAAMQGKAVNLAGRTSLKTLAALYEKIDCLVTTDTGPMHLAAAVNKPVVALFGPTAPWRTGPYGEGHQVVRAEMECSPCFKQTCQTKACMTDISEEQVMEAVARIRR